MFDLIVIGGGPGGVAAGVYASRKKLTTLFITKDWGGQSTVSEDIQNWIGTPHLKGEDLAKNLRAHLEEYAQDVVTIRANHEAVRIEKKGDTFVVTLKNGETHESKTVLLTTGSVRRKLTVPGADTYDNKGLTYCASCDGPMFSGADVAVVGGGNAAFETAAQLLAYAKSVTLLNRSSEYRADPVTVEKVLSHQNMRGITHATPTHIFGEAFVQGIEYSQEDGNTQKLAVSGVFVEIGLVPNTDLVKDLVALDEFGRVPIDPWTQQTSVTGLWAAGDCTNIKYHQNNISAGDAVRALEDIYVHLKAR